MRRHIDRTEHGTDTPQRTTDDDAVTTWAPGGLGRRPLLRRLGAASALGMSAHVGSGRARADHETDPCAVTIEFNRTQVGLVFDNVAAGIVSFTVFYFDSDGTARKQEHIHPTTNADYGPLRVRYDATQDKTVIQIGGPNTAIRRIIAFGTDCRTAATNPLADAAGENQSPTADFTWTPDPATVGQPVTFISTASDADGEIVHYSWDFRADGTEDATGSQVTHRFGTAGDHDVTHTIIDDFGAADTVRHSVTVEESPLSWTQVAKLVASDAEVGDTVGSVSLGGDTALVGVSGDDNENGEDAGAAYVFRFDGTEWVQQAKLVADDGAPDDHFGRSVSLDRNTDTVLVGAPSDVFASAPSPGAAYLFEFDGTEWVQRVKLVADDGAPLDGFGERVSLDRDTALITAPRDDNSKGEQAGAAYVFELSLDGTEWVQQAKLVGDDLNQFDNFGTAVSVDGHTALVGARDHRFRRNGAINEGAVYVFEFDGSSWEQEATLTAGEFGSSSGDFGSSVSLQRDTALVGAQAESGGGAAYVFRFDGTEWVQQARLDDEEDSHRDDGFGISVSLDGDTALVGEWRENNENGPGAGAVHVFTFDGRWEKTAKILAGDGGRIEDRFGVSVSLDGDVALVGAAQTRAPGAAYVFVE